MSKINEKMDHRVKNIYRIMLSKYQDIGISISEDAYMTLVINKPQPEDRIEMAKREINMLIDGEDAWYSMQFEQAGSRGITWSSDIRFGEWKYESLGN